MTDMPAAFTTAIAAYRTGEAPVLRKGADAASMQKASEKFEAFFLTQMLESMFKDVPTGGLFGGGPGEKIWRSMMLQEYGQVLAKAGGIGIADMVTREMIRLQEV